MDLEFMSKISIVSAALPPFPSREVFIKSRENEREPPKDNYNFVGI